MKSLSLQYFYFVFCGLFVVQAFAFQLPLLNEVKSHLSKYEQYNKYHHDNIDEETHIHSHRHGEDGEEHEHHHDHNALSISEFKLYSSNSNFVLLASELKSTNGFWEKFLYSTAFPLSLFRPPIA